METMQNTDVALNVYIVNEDGKLCRVINTEAKLTYAGVSIPILHISDNMVKKMIGRDSLYFYNPKTGRINFYSDSLQTICNLETSQDIRISIECLEVGDNYVLLTPGLWVYTSENGARRRLCDDASLYDIIGMLSAEALGGTDFMYEFKSVVARLTKPVENTVANDAVEDEDASNDTITIEDSTETTTEE